MIIKIRDTASNVNDLISDLKKLGHTWWSVSSYDIDFFSYSKFEFTIHCIADLSEEKEFEFRLRFPKLEIVEN